MKKFMVLLLSVIIITLIAGSVQSVAADHLEPGQGIFKDMTDVNLVVRDEGQYQVYLQIVIRNVDGQLVKVTESTAIGAYLDHNLTDQIFDTLMGKKEIITIDNTGYEKVQYIFSPSLEERFIGLYPIFSSLAIEFESEKDAYKKMTERDKDYSIWKIHYCAEFDGHGYRCIPAFQALIPTMTLESDDVVTQQWTILRQMN